jgi:uncharacterized protein YprB with RNaseH-like and TPR domain
VLKNTFIHLPGFTPNEERELWNAGVRDWDMFLDHFGKSPEHKRHCSHIASSKYALTAGDASYFASVLPVRERWRAFTEFERVAYVDIETTGLGMCDHTTVIGLYDGCDVSSYIYGKNLNDFVRDISEFDMIVTFNGHRFDLPFIRRQFGPTHVPLPALHIDLLYVMHALNQYGGLKAIEKRFGLERDDDLKGLNGYDAVKLWQKYKKENDEQSLSTLVRYNAADISNLQPLMEWAYKEMKKLTGIDR